MLVQGQNNENSKALILVDAQGSGPCLLPPRGPSSLKGPL